jgi:hypothetical protein
MSKESNLFFNKRESRILRFLNEILNQEKPTLGELNKQERRMLQRKLNLHPDIMSDELRPEAMRWNPGEPIGKSEPDPNREYNPIEHPFSYAQLDKDLETGNVPLEKLQLTELNEAGLDLLDLLREQLYREREHDLFQQRKQYLKSQNKLTEALVFFASASAVATMGANWKAIYELVLIPLNYAQSLALGIIGSLSLGTIFATIFAIGTLSLVNFLSGDRIGFLSLLSNEK